MIFICVKFPVKPEYADQWPELAQDFTAHTRAEPGNIFYDWSRSVENPNEYVLIEAFQDDAAGDHVNSDHFKRAQAELPRYLVRTPQVRNMVIPGESWDDLVEFKVD